MSEQRKLMQKMGCVTLLYLRLVPAYIYNPIHSNRNVLTHSKLIHSMNFLR
jgi:hypothetical protein